MAAEMPVTYLTIFFPFYNNKCLVFYSLIKCQNNVGMSVCSYHVTYTFQSESTLHRYSTVA